MHSLALLVVGDIEAEYKQEYIADALWLLVQYASMGKSEFPQYRERFREPEEKKTAQEIISDVLRAMEN